VWQGRVNRDYRFYFRIVDDTCRILMIIPHPKWFCFSGGLDLPQPTGSDRGGQRAAAMYSLIATARLNDVVPRAWLADVLRRIGDHPVSRLTGLLPWNWRTIEIAAAT